MPEEIFVIVIVGIAAGTLSGIVSQVIGYMKTRAPQANEGTSMTTSELEGMIRKWIKEETRPIQNRLGTIEDRLELPAANSQQSILDDMDGYEAADEGKALASRQKSRS